MNVNTSESSESEIESFENLKYSIADNNNNILLDDSCDRDVNFFNVNFENLNTPYLFPEDFNSAYENESPSNYFSVLHLNIRSIKKNFENFKMFLNSINFTFSIICFSETWLDETNSTENSLYELPNYMSKHQVRSDRRGGRVSIYIHKTFDFKVWSDLSINNKDIDSISVEISSNKKRNTLVNILYRPPNGKIEPFENFLNNVFTKTKDSNKALHNAGDFNLNLLDHNANRKVYNFLSLIYQNGMIPTINRPTRVTKKTATAIDHILTNSFVETVFKTVIFKSNIFEHFPVCFFISKLFTKTK